MRLYHDVLPVESVGFIPRSDDFEYYGFPLVVDPLEVVVNLFQIDVIDRLGFHLTQVLVLDQSCIFLLPECHENNIIFRHEVEVRQLVLLFI